MNKLEGLEPIYECEVCGYRSTSEEFILRHEIEHNTAVFGESAE